MCSTTSPEFPADDDEDGILTVTVRINDEPDWWKSDNVSRVTTSAKHCSDANPNQQWRGIWPISTSSRRVMGRNRGRKPAPVSAGPERIGGRVFALTPSSLRYINDTPLQFFDRSTEALKRIVKTSARPEPAIPSSCLTRSALDLVKKTRSRVDGVFYGQGRFFCFSVSSMYRGHCDKCGNKAPQDPGSRRIDH